MGDLVDLDAFRKQRKEEEEAAALAEAEAKAAEEEAELEKLRIILDSLVSSLGEITGSAYLIDRYDDGWESVDLDDYSSYTVYTHEAGYDEDGYYDRSWEVNPFEVQDDEEPDF